MNAMAITFQTDCATIMLPETCAQLVDPVKAREAIDRDRNIRRSHLYPLLDATARFACSFLIAPQGCEPFDLPREPWIIILGDDLHFAWGPKSDPYYSTEQHRVWRLAVCERASWRCEAVEDGRRCDKSRANGSRMFADHVIERSDGGQDQGAGMCLCGTYHTEKTNTERAKRMSRRR
jgi:5-methylcytosine-specific restriction protein A